MKTAMHVHSTWSYDGRWPLERIVAAFTQRGYRILLMTEHDQGFTEERRLAYWEACRKASTDQLLVVPGIEYSDPSNTIHLLVWGDIPFLGTGQAIITILEKATAQGGICIFAHPSRRSAWRLFQDDWLKYLSGIEIWNRKTDGWAASPDAIKLIARTGSNALVGLDFHSPKQFFPLALCLDITGRPDAEKTLAALRAGSYRGEAFGMNVQAFTGAMTGSATRGLEQGRRLAARTFRFAVSRSSLLTAWFLHRAKQRKNPPPSPPAKAEK